MKPVHFHLVYIGKDQFQFTLTVLETAQQLITVVRSKELANCLRKMKPGEQEVKVGTVTVTADMDLAVMREYFNDVYRSYQKALASGRDLDAEIREMERKVDIADGSGHIIRQDRRWN